MFRCLHAGSRHAILEVATGFPTVNLNHQASAGMVSFRVRFLARSTLTTCDSKIEIPDKAQSACEISGFEQGCRSKAELVLLAGQRIRHPQLPATIISTTSAQARDSAFLPFTSACCTCTVSIEVQTLHDSANRRPETNPEAQWQHPTRIG